ncbi:hypothetical protein PTKIN_Ptkin12aG0110100 [Pterospermum kingtungense]
MSSLQAHDKSCLVHGDLSWKSLLEEPFDHSVPYFEWKGSVSKNSLPRVEFPDDVHDEGLRDWKNALVAQFVGKIPNYSAFQKSINLLWGEEEEIDLRPAGRNLFVAKFLTSEARDRVLEKRPWHVQNQLLIVRKWEPNWEVLELNWSKVPIWVHLKGVPLELFTRRGIGYLASVLGVPLYMDRFTAERKRLEYARVCIELDVNKEIPGFIEAVRRNGSIVTVEVVVPWLPAKCEECQVFGHSAKACSKKSVRPVTQIKIDFQGSNVVFSDSGTPIKNNAGGTKDKGKGIVVDNSGEIPGSRKQASGVGGSVGHFEILNVSGAIENLLDELEDNLKKQREAAKKANVLFNSIKPKAHSGKGGSKRGT